MISKKKLSNTRRLALGVIDTAEGLVRLTPAILGIAAIGLVAFLIQREINKGIEERCPESISVIVKHPTTVGPSFQCVSRAQLQGPAPALKP